MKKILTVLLMGAMAVSITACNTPSIQVSQPSQDSSVVSSEPESSLAEESSQESSEESSQKSSSVSTKKYQSLDEFVNSDEAAQVVEQTQKTAGDLISFDLLAEDGNKLVYQYAYNEQVEADKSVLKESLNSFTDLYADIAESMEAIINVDELIVVVRYVNADDTLIYEHEFNKDSIAEEVSDEESSQESSSVSTKKYQSLDEFVNSDEAVQVVEQTQKTAGDLINFDLLAEDGNKLVYQYAYNEQVEADESVLKESLNSLTDLYANIAESMEAIINVDELIVVVRYINADDTLIYEHEFNKDSIAE